MNENGMVTDTLLTEKVLCAKLLITLFKSANLSHSIVIKVGDISWQTVSEQSYEVQCFQKIFDERAFISSSKMLCLYLLTRIIYILLFNHT